MIVRARAPLRIGFAGGGTDLSPYVEEHGGLVLNATIDRFAYATLRFPAERVLRVQSLDLDAAESYALGEALPEDGKLDLIKGCLARLVPEGNALDSGLELYLETDAPPGSGLGASSALVVATIGALRKWRHLSMDNYEMAHLAWEIERRDVGIPGGLQDQYAAVFGGFNLIEFRGPRDVLVNPLRIPFHIVNELQYNSLLVFTGHTRRSSSIIEAQVAGYVDAKPGVVEAMHRMKTLTIDAKNALLRGRLADLAEILDAEWTEKKRTADTVSNPFLDEMYAEARRCGAIGGKVSGAGGGGFMFLLCPFDRRPNVSQRLAEMGGQAGSVVFEFQGMQSWVWADGD